MTQEDKELLMKDLCARLPYGVTVNNEIQGDFKIYGICENFVFGRNEVSHIDFDVEKIKPYLFPLSSMTEEEYTIYLKIWEDTGKMAYLEGCHHLIINIKAYKAANDYLLSKHYDINGLIPKGLAIDATGKGIY